MRIEEFFSNIGTVTMKLTMGCNLKCTYCNTETVTPNTPMMPIELWKRVADLVIGNSRDKYLSLEFHGGEPMLLSDAWLEEATSYCRELAQRHGKMVNTPMVTNGTMLTEERLNNLSRMGILFSMSCDGPPEINDQARAAGHAVQRAIELFLEKEVRVGVMTVVNRANYNRMREVMDWFADLGLPDFRSHFVQPQGRGMEGTLLTADEMLESSIDTLDHMVETDVSIYDAEVGQHVERFVDGRDGSPRQTCWEYNCQAGRSYVAVNLQGQIHACGSDQFSHVIGSAYANEIDDEQHRKVLAALHDKDDWYIRCFDCSAKQICNFSCATSNFNSLDYREHECRFTKMFWNHLCEHPEKANHIYNIVSSRGWIRPKAFVPVSDLAYSAPATV